MSLLRTDSIDSVDFLVLGEELKAVQAEEERAPTAFKRRETAGELQPEPLLVEDKSRFVLFPIKHTDVRKAQR
jgi:hypothetical protein